MTYFSLHQIEDVGRRNEKQETNKRKEKQRRAEQSRMHCHCIQKKSENLVLLFSRHRLTPPPTLNSPAFSCLTDAFIHSNVRQVPDNQEVYLDGDGFSSIVVEILERVEQDDEGRALDDKGALEYHLRDLVEDEEDDASEKTRVWSTADAVGGKLP